MLANARVAGTNAPIAGWHGHVVTTLIDMHVELSNALGAGVAGWNAWCRILSVELAPVLSERFCVLCVRVLCCNPGTHYQGCRHCGTVERAARCSSEVGCRCAPRSPYRFKVSSG